MGLAGVWLGEFCVGETCIRVCGGKYHSSLKLRLKKVCKHFCVFTGSEKIDGLRRHEAPISQ